jgi:glycosyltransferase involved in cell wall biosynthesis
MKTTSSASPLVSIITPVFNQCQFIEIAIRSVLAQTYPAIEHVIVDGKSTDGSVEVIAALAQQYPGRIRFSSEPDQGPCDAFNKGCSMAQGEIFGWLGADDIYLPHAVQTVVNRFKAKTETAFVYGESDMMDARGEVIGRFATCDFSVERALNHGACFAFSTAFFRREVIEKVGGFLLHDEACDHDWVIRAGLQFPISRLPETLGRFRMHAGGKTASRGDEVYPKAVFLINRRYGGKWLSPVCRQYYRQLVKRVPLLGSVYERYVEYAGFDEFIDPHIRRIAVFGAALTGYQCMETAIEHKRVVPLFIDNFPPPSGLFRDRPVVTPEHLALKMQQEVDAVIVATKSRSGAQMRRQLLRLGFKKPIYCWQFSKYKNL